MTQPFGNLKLLRDDMRANGWIVEVFDFNYKQQKYHVVVELYQNGECKPKYALCKLRFMDKNELNRELITPANSQGIDISTKELRMYFGIEYRENPGSIIRQFTEYLGRFIPAKSSSVRTENAKRVLVRS